MIEAARVLPANSLALLNLELRCVPGIRRARDLVSNGAVGKVEFMHITVFWSSPNWAKNATFSHWHSGANGGGVWSDVGNHCCDLARFILREEVARVSAVGRPLINSLPLQGGGRANVTAPSFVSARLKMATSGTLVHITVSCCNSGLPEDMKLLIVGHNGSITFDLLSSEMHFFQEGRSQPVEGVPAAGSAFSGVGLPILGEAIQYKLIGRNPPPKRGMPQISDVAADVATLADGLMIQQVHDAVRKSTAQGGQWVPADTSVKRSPRDRIMFLFALFYILVVPLVFLVLRPS